MITRLRLSFVLVALLGVGISTAGQEQNPVFRSRRDVVRLDVLVNQGGRPVLGLKAEDFRIKDNGVPQVPEFLSFDEVPLNVTLTIDVSGSMSGQHMSDLRAAGHAVVDLLRKDDRAALIAFSHAAALRVALTSDRTSLGRALDETTAQGHTSLVDATLAGLTLSGSDAGRSLVLVFSDGMDTSSWLEPSTVIDAAKRVNAVVVAVTLGKHAPFLKDLTEATGGDVVEVKASSDLRPAFVRLLNEYRQRYLVGYTPAGVSSTGFHKLEVSVARGGVSVRTRPGYQAK